MKITFLKAEISNFMGIASRTYEFGPGINRIIGRNRAGKTNSINAISWCLFGKDFSDRKKFNIVPLNPDQSAQKVDPCVALTIMVDGAEHTLKRQLKGSVTTCEIDGAPKKVSEYDDFIASLFGSEERFKMFSMPLFFPESLHWTKQRELLMQFFPEPHPNDVFSEWMIDVGETKCCQYSKDFYVAMQNMKPADYAAKHEKELKECEARRLKIDAQIELLDKQLEGNHELDLSALEAERESLRESIRTINEKIQKAVDYNSKIGSTKAALDNKLARLRHESSAFMDGKVSEYNNAKAKLEYAIKEQKLVLESKRKEWASIKETAILTTCPTCGQSMPAEKVSSAKESITAMKAQIIAEGKEAQKVIDELSASLAALLNPRTIAHPEIDALVAQGEEAMAKLNKLPEMVPVPMFDPAINDRLAEIDKALARSDVHKENIERREQLEAMERKLNIEADEHERAIKEAGQYIFYRSKVVVDQVNARFKTISVKIFETQKNGVVKETFEITRDGVPYSDLNTASQFEAGLELISFLKSALDIECPVIVDNGERYTDVDFGDIKGQVIIAAAKKGAALKLEVV